MSEGGEHGLIRMPQRRPKLQMGTTSPLTLSGSCCSSGGLLMFHIKETKSDTDWTEVCCIQHFLNSRCWCPDRTLAQARKYISETMGERYAEGVILDLEKTWEESDSRTPLICFLSMGSDPTNNIEALAKKLKLECHAISMGQGQEVHARRLLQQSMSAVSELTRRGKTPES